MFIIIGLLLVAGLVVAVSRFRVPGGSNARHLGTMSEPWRAEQRMARRP